MPDDISPHQSVDAFLSGLPESLRGSPHAAQALILADLLPTAEPHQAPAISRELRMVLAELRQLAAGVTDGVNPIDELAQRRAARRASAVSDRPGGGEQRGG